MGIDVFADIVPVDVECKARDDLDVVIGLPGIATGIAVGTASFSVKFLDGEDWADVELIILSVYVLVLKQKETHIFFLSFIPGRMTQH